MIRRHTQRIFVCSRLVDERTMLARMLLLSQLTYASESPSGTCLGRRKGLFAASLAELSGMVSVLRRKALEVAGLELRLNRCT